MDKFVPLFEDYLLEREGDVILIDKDNKTTNLTQKARTKKKLKIGVGAANGALAISAIRNSIKSDQKRLIELKQKFNKETDKYKKEELKAKIDVLEAKIKQKKDKI